MELLLNNKGLHKKFDFCLNVVFVNCRSPQGLLSCLIPDLWLLWSQSSGQTPEPVNSERPDPGITDVELNWHKGEQDMFRRKLCAEFGTLEFYFFAWLESPLVSS